MREHHREDERRPGDRGRGRRRGAQPDLRDQPPDPRFGDRAEECIEDLPGVRDVHNELRALDRREAR